MRMKRSMALVCVTCAERYAPEVVRYRCDCGDVLDVVHEKSGLDAAQLRARFDDRLGSWSPVDRSGVWRYRELILPLDENHLAAKPEGDTTLYDVPRIASYAGMDRVYVKHEGENPTGSFKDRGMTTGVSVARWLGLGAVACASTGNTSASMASYAAQFGLDAYVFIPEGNIAYGKLSQALAYGAKTLQIRGSFDDAMRLVEQVCAERGIYLLNSVNPFRLEGQKAIGFELLHQLGWSSPDWIVLPGGNLGNNSAIYKGLCELYALGMITRIPRIAVVQAHGANPLYRAYRDGGDVTPIAHAETIATAIRIGAPVSWRKSLRAIAGSNGVVTEVTDEEILEAKAHVDRSGVGAEPASCASIAGLRRLVREGTIKPSERVVCILTGHLLKDPEVVVNFHMDPSQSLANRPVTVDAHIGDVRRALDAM